MKTIKMLILITIILMVVSGCAKQEKADSTKTMAQVALTFAMVLTFGSPYLMEIMVRFHEKEHHKKIEKVQEGDLYYHTKHGILAVDKVINKYMSLTGNTENGLVKITVENYERLPKCLMSCKEVDTTFIGLKIGDSVFENKRYTTENKEGVVISKDWLHKTFTIQYHDAIKEYDFDGFTNEDISEGDERSISPVPIVKENPKYACIKGY